MRRLFPPAGTARLLRAAPCLLLVSILVASSAGCRSCPCRRAGGTAAERRSPPRRQSPKPFLDARSRLAEYAGPGREDPPPEDVSEVAIGWFGPADPAHPAGGAMWQGALLAIEEANRERGLDGVPFRLIPAWSENPWGTGVRDVVRLVYEDRVWALAGAPDSASAHLVEQIVTKARLVFVNPLVTDKTTNLANVPWIFSLAPPDPLVAKVLADALAAGGRFAILSGTDHASRQLAGELLKALKRRGAFPVLHLHVRPGGQGLPGVLERAEEADPETIAILADSRESARLLRALRSRGVSAAVVGGPAMARRAFLEREAAGEEAGPLLYPLLWSARGPRAAGFAARFRERYGDDPDDAAAFAYDAARVLVRAIRSAGLNRARIRDAVRELSPFEGVTGRIEWDPTGRRAQAEVSLSRR